MVGAAAMDNPDERSRPTLGRARVTRSAAADPRMCVAKERRRVVAPQAIERVE